MPASDPLFSYLSGLGETRFRFGLGRIRKLLSGLNFPDRTFPSIHIAGTNGKGSVAAMLSSILVQSGYRVGLYTSPHLIDIRERFQINGAPITKKAFRYHANQLRHSIKKILKNPTGLSHFEFLTALAFVYFSKQKVDIAIIETGLGGRLDATNILSNVKACIITNIGKDHTQWLGTRLSQIAKEKSGIIKKGIPVITGARGIALRTIRSAAKRKNSPVFFIQKPNTQLKNFALALSGPHQQINASLVLALIPLLKPDFEIPKSAIQNGFRNVKWPGRGEIFRTRIFNKQKTIILDGAHNLDALKALNVWLQKENIQKPNLLFGVLRDKNIPKMILSIDSIRSQTALIPVPSERSADPAHVVRFFKKNPPPRLFLNLTPALRYLSNSSKPILVTGSLYLVGLVKQWMNRNAKVNHGNS